MSSSTNWIWASLASTACEPEATGRPAYHPAVLLKIYIYGYLNRIQSSRRLERETQRNVELMWLTGRLTPDFKTIADFRKDNGEAIRNVCREFIVLCRRLNLFAEAIVAIDGSKFKAVNNRDKNFTERKMQAADGSSSRRASRATWRELDRGRPASRRWSLKAGSRGCKEKIATRQGADAAARSRSEQQLQAAPDQQVSLTDPDARSMATSGRGTGIVGYNVQTAVDTKHHLIVAHEVTNVGHDRSQLSTMAKQAREATGSEDADGRGRSRLLQRRGDSGVRPGRHHATGAQAADLQQQGRRALRQARLRLHRRATMSTAARPASGRSSALPPIEHGHDAAQVLALGLPALPDQGAMHDQATTGGSRAGSTRRCSTRCRSAWISSPRRCGCAGRPSSIRSARSKPGWARPTS